MQEPVWHQCMAKDCCPPSNMKRRLRQLSLVVNGDMMGFVINKKCVVNSIRKLNIKIQGDFRLSFLLNETYLRYAVISVITESLVFLLPPSGNRMQVFSNGQLVCKYQNGEWYANDFSKFEALLFRIGEEKGYDIDTIKKIGKTAIQMADSGLGALFVLFDERLNVAEKYDDCLAGRDVELTEKRVQDFDDAELINFAKEDGAVLIDSKGFLRSFMAMLRPRPIEDLTIDQGVGSRHLSAQRFSAEINCLTIVVSEDSTVTVYSDGKKVYRI